MNREHIEQALNDLISMYKDMENEYGVNLTKEVDHVKNVLEDIPEAIRKVELK